MINYNAFMEQTKPNRGDRTRDKLIEAAITLFGRDGYHATRNRGLANRAGVNQALIGYHFGGKHGLYLAVFDAIAEQMSARMGPMATHLYKQMAPWRNEPHAHRKELIALIETMLCSQLRLLCEPQTDAWAKLILREQQEPGEAFQRLYDGPMKQVITVLCELIGLVSDRAADSVETRLQAMMLIGQVLVFRAARATALHLLGWQTITEKERSRIEDQLRTNIQAQFSGGTS